LRVVAVNVGMPREVPWEGGVVATGIFKTSVEGPVMVRALNLDGDQQADLTVHGGPDKAVYAYPGEHYDFWRGEFPGKALAPGMFGENLTTEGLDEESVHIGDRFRIGEAELIVTQPRFPCFKLGIKFGDPTMVNRFLASRRTGVYFRVVAEGSVWPSAPIVLLEREEHQVAVAEFTRLYAFDRGDTATLRRVLEVAALPESWVQHFTALLQRAERKRR